jgi:hypothetical protein
MSSDVTELKDRIVFSGGGQTLDFASVQASDEPRSGDAHDTSIIRRQSPAGGGKNDGLPKEANDAPEVDVVEGEAPNPDAPRRPTRDVITRSNPTGPSLPTPGLPGMVGNPSDCIFVGEGKSGWLVNCRLTL